MIIGCDLSSEYTPDFDVRAAHAEGIRFVAVKLGDSLKGTEPFEDGIRVIRDATSLGMPTWGYWFSREGAPPQVDADRFAAQLRRAGAPGAIDWEETAASKPNVDQLRATVGAVWASGARLCFTYAPRWYWLQNGSPSLAGLPPLWGSHYVLGEGSPGPLAVTIPASWWEGHGGLPMSVLQFSRVATIVGRKMTADAYRGTVADLHREVYG